nr:unnamed protein product [Callosobruchus analis]
MTAVQQINLHHSRAAMATLCQKILADDIGVLLIQEPWTVKGRVMGMSTAKDHNYISFYIKSTCVKETYRNPEREIGKNSERN